MEKEIKYNLSEPLEYAQGGEMTESQFVTLTAPTSKNMTECAFLKQAFFRSLPTTGEVEAEESTEGDAPLDGGSVMMLITMSPDVELGPVLVTGRELLTSGVAMVGGEQKLTKPIADNLPQDDLEGMIGAYMANFILASALRKAKKMS